MKCFMFALIFGVFSCTQFAFSRRSGGDTRRPLGTGEKLTELKEIVSGLIEDVNNYITETKNMVSGLIEYVNIHNTEIKEIFSSLIEDIHNYRTETKDMVSSLIQDVNNYRTETKEMVSGLMEDANNHTTETKEMVRSLIENVNNYKTETKDMVSSLIEDVDNYRTETKEMVSGLIEDANNYTIETKEMVSNLIEDVNNYKTETKDMVSSLIDDVDNYRTETKKMVSGLIKDMNNHNTETNETKKLLSGLIKDVNDYRNETKEMAWGLIEYVKNYTCRTETKVTLSSLIEDVNNYRTEAKELNTRMSDLLTRTAECTRCPIGQEYKQCGNGCPLTCDPASVRVACPSVCIEGCFCSEDTVLHYGNCILPAECPKCPAGQEFKYCGNACLSKCNPPLVVCSPECTAGCFCVEGTVLNGGSCIPLDECPLTPEHCPDGQEFKECGSACPATCDLPSVDCSPECVAGCFCAEGMVLYDGNCISPDECPPAPSQCPEGQEYKECGSGCPATCNSQPILCSPRCVAGCFCVEGTVFDHNGNCIPPDTCPNYNPGQCPEGQDYPYGHRCTATCIPSIISMCTDDVLLGCFCSGDRVLYNGKCISPDECPPTPDQCPEGQEFKKCGNLCPLTCDPSSGPCGSLCFEGCFCSEGMVLHDWNCIPLDECPLTPEQCPDGQEYKECGSSCPPSCDPLRVDCSPECVAGCFCVEGTVLNGGSCIPLDECPPTPEQCPDGQEYKECGSACLATCDPLHVVCSPECVAGCFCAEGTVLNGGSCIPLDECPLTSEQCPEGQEYKECGSACPETCDPPSVVCSPECVAGCFCPEGTVLNGGSCIPLDECPLTPEQCPKGQEYKECGSACPATCDPPSMVCSPECVAGCFCAEGTVLYGGSCIPLDECPLTPEQCPDGQEYTECGSACPATCDPPNVVCSPECVAGCFCPEGTVLNGGSCIPLDECPPTHEQCPEGQEYKECGSACPATCDPPLVVCSSECVAGCFCPEGTVLNDQKCVSPEECP